MHFLVNVCIGKLCRNLDILDNAFRLAWKQTVFTHTVQMESDSLANLLFAFLLSRPGGDAAWQVRNIGRKIRSGIFNHNGIAHGGHTY